MGSANGSTLWRECLHAILVSCEGNWPLCHALTAQAEVTVSIVMKLFAIWTGLAAVSMCHQNVYEPAGMLWSHNEILHCQYLGL